MNELTRQSRRTVLLFLLLTLVFSSVFYALIIHTGRLESGFRRYVTGLMWCPGLAGLATCWLLGRPVATLGWRWGSRQLLWGGYLLPVCYGLAAYLLVWLAGWGGFYNTRYVAEVATAFGFEGLPAGAIIALYVVFEGVFGMPTSMALALGEEIGWRGLLTPTLYPRLGFTATALVTGAIWAVWHYPILLFADYNSGTPAWYGLSCFTVQVLSSSVISAWLRQRSGSLWPCVLLHASHNLFIQGVFDLLTRDTGRTRYFIGEFGAVLSAATAMVALYFWRRRAELPAPMPIPPLLAEREHLLAHE